MRVCRFPVRMAVLAFRVNNLPGNNKLFHAYGRALATVLTRLRPASATIVMARPDVMRLIPTISPSAQVAVLGHPLMISAARIRSAIPLANIHPQEFGEYVAIAERCGNLKDAFDKEEGDQHQGKRDRAFGRMPEQQDADEQRECRRKQ